MLLRGLQDDLDIKFGSGASSGVYVLSSILSLGRGAQIRDFCFHTGAFRFFHVLFLHRGPSTTKR